MKQFKKLVVLAAVAAAAMMVATVAFGATPGSDGKVKACVLKGSASKGHVRFLESSTAKCDSTYEWSVTLPTAAAAPTPTPSSTPTPTPAADTVTITVADIKAHISESIGIVGLGFSNQQEIDNVSNFFFRKLKGA